MCNFTTKKFFYLQIFYLLIIGVRVILLYEIQGVRYHEFLL